MSSTATSAQVSALDSGGIDILNAGPPAGTAWQPIVNRHSDLHVRTRFDCTAGDGAIVSAAGPLAAVDPAGLDLSNGAFTSNSQMFYFTERVRQRLDQDLFVDFAAPGHYRGDDTRMPTAIPAGSFVSSHFVHFDNTSGTVILQGTLSFASDVLGVIMSDGSMLGPPPVNLLLASDPVLGYIGDPNDPADDTIYPTGNRRGWEIDDPNANDFIEIAADRRSVTFRGLTDIALDQLRIVTAASPADLLAEPYVDSTGYIPGADEVTFDNCSSAFYRFTFTLPAGFTNASLFGTANADDYGVVFLNGHRISPAITQADVDAPGTDRVDPNTAAALLSAPTPDAFGTCDSSLFVAGENELVFGVLSLPGRGPTGLEFAATVAFDLTGDLNGDGCVDLNDLSVLLANFGTAGGPTDGDLNGDGTVDLTDLSQLLTNFGSGCGP